MAENIASTLRRQLQERSARLGDDLRDRRESAARRVRLAVTGDEERKVREHVKANVEAKVENAKQQLRALKDRAHTKLQKRHEPRTSRLLDQCSFSVGVIGIVLSQYIMLAHERWFHVWYAVVVPAMYFAKWGVYKLNKMH